MKVKVVKFSPLFQITSVEERYLPNNHKILIYVDKYGWYRKGSDKQGYQFCDFAAGAKIFNSISSAKNSDVYKRFKESRLKLAEISWSGEVRT